MTTKRRPQVVVAGGGLAGMAAALVCADGGAAVTLLEARPRLGGATHSFRRGGLWVDNGQHVFLRCCTEYRGFLRRIGAEGLTTLQDRLSIPVLEPGGRTGFLSRSPLPAPLHLARALAVYPFLRPAERARAMRTALALARLDPADRSLDRQTFGSWLERRHEPVRSIEAVWNLIALPTLNLPASAASLALAVKVFRTGLLDRNDAADIGYASAPLTEVHGRAAVRALSRAGVRVLTRAPVRCVLRNDDAPWAVEAEGVALQADAVILAVPHDRAAELLPVAAVGERIGGLGFAPIVNVHVVYDRTVTALPFAAGVGTPVQWVFDRTAVSGLDHGQYLAISLSGADREIEERTETLRRRFLPALAELFPRARAAMVERFFVTRERRATFRQSPGTASLRPGPRTYAPGLFLAGAWTDTGWPATMEGAVRSGVAAAREALSACALRAPQPGPTATTGPSPNAFDLPLEEVPA
jgi:squalene-associated FAD-dependent desaturase